jgi:predicted DNA binding CopG/RHH family protein
MHDKFKDIKLDKYEKEIEKHFDGNNTYPSDIEEGKMQFLKNASQSHVKQNKRVTINLNIKDLDTIKAMAEEEGLPYQAFITSILHKVSIKKIVDLRLN